MYSMLAYSQETNKKTDRQNSRAVINKRKSWSTEVLKFLTALHHVHLHNIISNINLHLTFSPFTI